MGVVVSLQEVVELAVAVVVAVELAEVVAVVAEEVEGVAVAVAVAEVKQTCVLRNLPFTNYQNRYYSPLLLRKCQQRFAKR